MNEEIDRSQAYLRIIDTGVGYDSAFLTLCTIVDTWDDVDSIHVRECLKDTLSDGKYDLIAFAGDEELFTVDNLQELEDMTLPIVMVKAASDPAVSDLVLEHMIKDDKCSLHRTFVISRKKATSRSTLNWGEGGLNPSFLEGKSTIFGCAD